MENLRDLIKSYLSYCEKEKRLSKHTIKAYRIDLSQFCLHKKDMSIAKEDLVMYIHHLHENYKPKTVRRKIASLKAFIHYLYYQDVIPGNPFDKIDTSFKEPLLLPRTIPAYLIQRILSASYEKIKAARTASAKAVAIRDTSVLELLFATGARISEICSLKPENVDLDAQTVRILGKGSKERIIEIENYDVLSILKRYYAVYQEDIISYGFFFLNNRKNRLSEQSVRFMIKRLGKEIDSQIHITPHMFRHSMATMLLEEDVDIRYIQRILGHSSITTTQIYTHVTSSKQKEILRTKHPRNKIHIT